MPGYKKNRVTWLSAFLITHYESILSTVSPSAGCSAFLSNHASRKQSCPATRSRREDQALLLRRRLPLVPRAASPHGGNLVAVNDIWVHPLDTCDVLELCVSLIIRGSLTICSGLCGCSASLTSVSLHGCLASCGVRLSCLPPWNLITVKSWL